MPASTHRRRDGSATWSARRTGRREKGNAENGCVVQRATMAAVKIVTFQACGSQRPLSAVVAQNTAGWQAAIARSSTSSRRRTSTCSLDGTWPRSAWTCRPSTQANSARSSSSGASSRRWGESLGGCGSACRPPPTRRAVCTRAAAHQCILRYPIVISFYMHMLVPRPNSGYCDTAHSLPTVATGRGARL